MIDIKKTCKDFDATAARLAQLASLIVAVAFAAASSLHAAQPLARATPESQGCLRVLSPNGYAPWMHKVASTASCCCGMGA